MNHVGLILFILWLEDRILRIRFKSNLKEAFPERGKELKTNLNEPNRDKRILSINRNN